MVYPTPFLSNFLGACVLTAAAMIGPGQASSTPVAKPPQESAVRILLHGQYQYDNGYYEAAIALYTAAIARDPENVEAYAARAGALGNLADYPAAIADYSAAIALAPELAAAYGGRGVANYLKGDLEAAVADLWQASQLFHAQENSQAYFKTLEFLKSIAP